MADNYIEAKVNSHFVTEPENIADSFTRHGKKQ
jgi:hypothetical protein